VKAVCYGRPFSFREGGLTYGNQQYEMRFPPRHLENDEFNFFDEESFIE
jgi:guanyl-specific ribonuclease Sa